MLDCMKGLLVNNDAVTMDLDCLVSIQGWSMGTPGLSANNWDYSEYNSKWSLAKRIGNSDLWANRLARHLVNCKCAGTYMDYLAIPVNPDGLVTTKQETIPMRRMLQTARNLDLRVSYRLLCFGENFQVNVFMLNIRESFLSYLINILLKMNLLGPEGDHSA